MENKSVNPYIPALLTLLIFSRNHSQVKNMGTALIDSMKRPEIKRVLGSVCPYLDEDEQVPIHKIIGVLELIETIKSINNNSYRTPNINPPLGVEKKEKHLGIINTLKEHANADDRNLLDAVESAVLTAHKVQKVVGEKSKQSSNDMKAKPPQEASVNIDKDKVKDKDKDIDKEKAIK